MSKRIILGLRLAASAPLGPPAARLDDLDFLVLGDARPAAPAGAGGDPLSIAAALVPRTSRVGLIAAVDVSWAPFHVARALASFDHLSRGRCGWAPGGPPEQVADGRLAEHLDVVAKLFDSWDDDALVLDKTAGIFAARDKVRRIRHEGRHFTVDGPLNAPRPRQGQPVMAQSADVASDFADIILDDLDRLPPAAAGRLRIATMAFGADAEAIAEAVSMGRCDGVMLEPGSGAGDPAAAVSAILDRVRALGFSVAPHDGPDFRARLGLPRPANRFASVSRAVIA